MKILYRYFAVKPIKAEHPIGSGVIIEYFQGDEVPAGDWGRATDNLVELGKIQRVAFNVEDDVDETLTIEQIKAPAKAAEAPKRSPGRPRKADS